QQRGGVDSECRDKDQGRDGRSEGGAGEGGAIYGGGERDGAVELPVAVWRGRNSRGDGQQLQHCQRAGRERGQLQCGGDEQLGEQIGRASCREREWGADGEGAAAEEGGGGG